MQVFIRNIYEDDKHYIDIGLKHDLIRWKEQEQFYKDEGLNCDYDSTELIGNTNNMKKLIDALNHKLTDMGIGMKETTP